MRDPRRPRTANSKGTRLEEERNAEILHENTLLLEKLSQILTRDASANAAQIQSNRGQYSLREVQRRHNITRIDRENAALLKRLQFMKPTISGDALQQHWSQHAYFSTRSKMVANPLLAGVPRRTRPRSTGDIRMRAGREYAQEGLADAYALPFEQRAMLMGHAADAPPTGD